mgnify:CR=1 FL=1
MSKTIAIELIRVYLAGGQEAVRRHPIMTVLQQKESKDEACYGITGMPRGERCELCKNGHFGKPEAKNRWGNCDRVYGAVENSAWCMNFSLRRPRTEWKEAV